MSVTETGSDANNTALHLNRKHAWSHYTVPVTAYARFHNSLYAGSSLQGDVYKLRTGYTFNGDAYPLVATFKEDLLGSLELEKEINKIYVFYKTQNGGSFNFQYRLNNYQEPSGASWVSQTIDQGSNGPAEILVGNKCRSVQCRITQEEGSNVQILGFVILYSYLNLR
jgi:hypothetical protein